MTTPPAATTAAKQDPTAWDTPSLDRQLSYEERALDPTVPNVARMYDYFLGGKNHWPADRDAAEQLLKVAPWVRDAALSNRAFLGRAVEAVAASGVRQFIDIGSGLPTQNNVHEVAQRVQPDAPVVYVDIDPVVLVHARAILADNAHTEVVQADVRNIDAILDHPDVRRLIDFGEPIAVVMVALLHFLADADDPAAIVDTLEEALPPRSVLIFSHACTDGLEEGTVKEATAVYSGATATMTARSSADIHALFGDKWTWHEPGLVPVHDWRLDPDDKALLPKMAAHFLGGVAIPRRYQQREAA
ncbi:SAM-dependent methyltransferase [Nonomuraea turkmeniaca]|uniref:SAM-dependent methyltransferase n=1 Tax=Nonomuraea turkmeniaca TaxID=103838 RepID=A0A5S4FP33_9ACTN|nr:SAM-dependent methyltransferase [Nonomuraea turkmeniaca]TMR22452.1 SAM-dependent methyltransferase [Nonomuraea turkmeniaca]